MFVDEVVLNVEAGKGGDGAEGSREGKELGEVHGS